MNHTELDGVMSLFEQMAIKICFTYYLLGTSYNNNGDFMEMLDEEDIVVNGECHCT